MIGNKNSVLFTKIKINNLIVPNRFFRSATYEALGDREGRVTPEIIKLYSSYSKVGLIMSSCTLVDLCGRHHPTMLSLCSSDSAKSFQKLSDQIHRNDSAFGVQLAHSGGIAKLDLINEDLKKNCKKTLVSVETPNNLTISDIERIIESFRKSAVAARDNGADCVQLHCAGSFLLGSFLSKVSNHERNDIFGTKRSEIVLRIIHEIRKSVPSNYPVLVKLNGSSEKARIEPEELAEFAKEFENCGVNAIEIAVDKKSNNNNNNNNLNVLHCKASNKGNGLDCFEEVNGYDYEAVDLIKKKVKIPVISTGGYLRFKEEMEKAVNEGRCDMIGLSRPLIRQPGLIELFLTGKAKEADCRQCNGCLAYTSGKEKPIKCVSP